MSDGPLGNLLGEWLFELETLKVIQCAETFEDIGIDDGDGFVVTLQNGKMYKLLIAEATGNLYYPGV